MRLERIPNFITEAERKELIAWMDDGIENGVLVAGFSRGEFGYTGRKTTRLNPGSTEFPKIAFDIQKRLLDSFEWTDKSMIEPLDGGGMVAVVTYPGGDTYKHKDPKILSSAVRFNIILQKPVSGGELYVEGQNFSCDERELHCYNVTENEHWVTEVGGDITRYLWIFGMSIPYKDWEDGHIKRKVA
jgi:hypothetical protein